MPRSASITPCGCWALRVEPTAAQNAAVRRTEGRRSFITGPRYSDRPVFEAKSLLVRCEVAFLCPDRVTRIDRMQVDRAERAVMLELRRFIDQQVLAAQLFFDIVEADGHIVNTLGVESLTAGSVRDPLQHVVTLVPAGADVRADGVNNRLRALAHLDGFGLEHAAVVVVAVGDKNNCLAYSGVLLQSQHLVLAGPIERVEESCATAGPQP